MNFGYIYKVTNLINGKIYIGQKHGTFTPKYLGSGKIIKWAIKKYNKESFRLEVLAFATTQAMLDGLEQKYIYEYRQVFGNAFIYNINNGGLGHTGYRHSDEILKKIGEGNKGKIYSQESKNKMKLAWIERRKKGVSKNTKEKMSKAHKGISPFLGHNHSENTKNKISLKSKGRIHKNPGCVCCFCRGKRGDPLTQKEIEVRRNNMRKINSIKYHNPQLMESTK